MPICTAVNQQSNPAIVSDGSGGVIITWEDQRSAQNGSEDRDIYTQRVSATGQILWQEGGIPVCTANYLQSSPKIVSDGSGGAIIVWMDLRDYQADAGIFAQRINGDGNTIWQTNGIEILNGGALFIRITETGDGVLVAWSDESEIRKIKVQKININGEFMWSMGGVAVCSVSSWLMYYRFDQFDVISNGAGGSIVAWESDIYLTPETEIVIQNIDANGNTLWGADGEKIFSVSTPGDGHYIKPTLVSDLLGGAIVTCIFNNNGAGFAQLACIIHKKSCFVQQRFVLY
jgi:hypothetical protein